MTEELIRVRYSRRATQGVVAGLGGAAIASLAVCLLPPLWLVITGAGITTSVMALLLLSPIGVMGVVKRHGIPLSVWMVWQLRFRLRQRAGWTVFKRKIKPVAVGEITLPVYGERVSVWETDTGKCVVWDKHAGRASVMCMVASPGLALHGVQTLTAQQRQEMLLRLMQVAGSWTRREQIARVSFLERTRPGSVVLLREEAKQFTSEGPLAASYQQTLAQAERVSVERPQAIVITLDMKSRAGYELVKAHGGGMNGILAACVQEMSATEEALAQAGFTRVEWVTPREWGAWGRLMIDPASEARVDARLGSSFAGVAPELAAPVFMREEATLIETDSAFHRVYWIAEYPRLEVLPGFMGQVVMAQTHTGTPIRHTLYMCAEPVPLGKSLRDIRKARETWRQNADLKARRGRMTDVADNTDWENLIHRERELVAGQGELTWTGYIIVSALNREKLQSACASMETAASGAAIEVVPLTYQMGQALIAAAYPAGLGAR